MKNSIFLAAALALSGAVSAHAGNMNDQRQIVVRYDDVNVKQAAGARILLARIDDAAEAVCGPAPYIRDLNARGRFRDCIEGASSRAIASLPFDIAANLNSDMQTIAQR